MLQPEASIFNSSCDAAGAASKYPVYSQNYVDSKLSKLASVILSADLKCLEEYIYSYKDNPDELILVMEKFAKINNSKELIFSVRKHIHRLNGKYCQSAICEFSLVRARRILIIPSEPELATVVLEHQPMTVGKISCESPDLLMRQIGKIFAIPKFSPPPIISSPNYR